MNVINELEKSLGYIKVEDYLRNIGKRRKSFPSLLNISHAVIWKMQHIVRETMRWGTMVAAVVVTGLHTPSKDPKKKKKKKREKRPDHPKFF